MKRKLCILTIFVCLSGAVHAAPYVLSADEWARPRDGAYLVTLEPVAGAVRQWMRTPDGWIVVRHPGGEEGILWAREIEDWLVALGIPSSRIRASAGGPAPDQVILEVRQETGGVP